MAEDRAAEQSGQVLAGRYELETEIARGAIGTVWRARDVRTDEPVAVKVLLPETEHDPDVIRSLLDEAAILAQLKHPSIVGAIDVIANGVHALVMDLVEGVDVRQRIRTSGPLRPAEVAEISAQIADALAAVHAAGIVHGDVKPGNVLVPANGGPVKLGDFGVARRITLPDTVTHATPEYVSPEVVAGIKPQPSSDVYSLGMVIYEMTCGRSPYRGGSVAEVIERHSTCVPVQPAGMPDEMWSLVLRCVELDPDSRPPAHEIAAELRRLAPTFVGRPGAAMLPDYATTYRPRLKDPAGARDPDAPQSPAVPMAGAVVYDGPLWPEATPAAAGPTSQAADPVSARPISGGPTDPVSAPGGPANPVSAPAGPVSPAPTPRPVSPISTPAGAVGPVSVPAGHPGRDPADPGRPAEPGQTSVLSLFDSVTGNVPGNASPNAPANSGGGSAGEATAVAVGVPVPPEKPGGAGKMVALIAVAGALLLFLGIGASLLLWADLGGDGGSVAGNPPAPAPSKSSPEPDPTPSAEPSSSGSPSGSPSSSAEPSPTEAAPEPPGGGDDGDDGDPGLGDPMPTMPG